LASEIAGDVLTDDLARAMYSSAAGIYQILPVGVVRPRHRDDIIQALRWCREHDLPVTLRGGGTSPVDSCLGRGMIIDTTAYLGPVSEIDVHDDTVTAPAGVSYAAINERLAEFGRILPPHPLNGRAGTLGGLIATNAAGIHSARYGSIIDYVESLEVILADGSVLQTRPLDVRQTAFKDLIASSGADARLHRELYELLREQRATVKSKSLGRSTNASGYRLDATLNRGIIDLGKLMAGSEGTLGIITRARMHTVEAAPVNGMLVLYFESLQLAADSVRVILDASPCSVELIDARALDLVRSHRPDLGHLCRDSVQSVMIVEFDGADNDEIIPKLLETQRTIAEDGGTAVESVVATAEPDIEEIGDLREAALNALHNLDSRRRVTPFIEDIAVEPDMVSSCIHGLTEIAARHGVELAVNGHVGHGGICARPLLDLKSADDVRKTREIAEEAFAMVVEMGGTISAGHGDGLARTEFLRLQYGSLCDLFAQVKGCFDPEGLLNPGIKVGAERGTIVANLRFGEDYTRRAIEPKLLYSHEPRGDLIERCHGCGACRTLTEVVAMCPVYKALQTEESSPRAKANILRHLLSNRGTLPPEDEVVDQMTRLTDLCLGCKMCSVECPSAIDVGKLMVELRARRAEKGGLARDEKVARLWDRILPILATFQGFGNLITQSHFTRYLGERLFGIAAKRELPRFRVLELSGRHKPTLTKVRDRVVFFTGTYADCHSPEIQQCTLDVLLRNSTEVEVMSGVESGETRLRYGDVAGARKLIEKNLRKLAPLVEQGFRVVCTEPQTTLFFRRGMLDCVDTPDARAVAAASFDLMQFLVSLHRAGRLDTRFRAVPVPFAYHAPCHLRALQIGRPSIELLRLVPSLPIAELSGGCCGMAGTYGLRAKNYDLSMRIGRPLFEQMRHLEVRYGLSECGSCAMQLHQGSGKRVIHPIQVLHRAYGLPEQGMESW